MASGSLSPVLANEVAASWSTANPSHTPAPHRRDGDGESNVGRGTHRRGAPPETRSHAIAPNSWPLHAVSPADARWQVAPVVGRLPQESCGRRRRVRFLPGGHGHLSTAVRLRPPRHHDAPRGALECHRAPHCRMDDPAIRNGLPLDDAAYRFVVHDRDGIFALAVDDALHSMSLQVLKTPVRAPQANAHCERFIGTARRDCLDWMIPLTERHLRQVLAEWIVHYSGERPHSALGPELRTSPRVGQHRQGIS
jgi:hypothetical protein